jgi:hypothetical protein
MAMIATTATAIARFFDRDWRDWSGICQASSVASVTGRSDRVDSALTI